MAGGQTEAPSSPELKAVINVHNGIAVGFPPELPELKTVTSESRTGLSIVNVELTPDIKEEDLQPIWDKLRRKIDGIREDLPEGIKGPNVEDDGIRARIPR